MDRLPCLPREKPIFNPGWWKRFQCYKLNNHEYRIVCETQRAFPYQTLDEFFESCYRVVECTHCGHEISWEKWLKGSGRTIGAFCLTMHARREYNAYLKEHKALTQG